MGLKRYKLGDLIEVTRGQSLAGEFYAEEGKYIRLTLGNFDYANGGFKPNTSKTNLYYTGPIKEQFILEEGDIITPLTEQTPGLLGSTARIPVSGTYIQSQDVALVRCKDGMIDPAFCYYLLPSSSVKKQLAAGAQQTKIRHTSPDKIRDVVVDIPDISEQRRIGQLLDAITHKIELNRSINQNLEALAKQLYDYWFVQFDFPNEEGRPYKSSGGAMVWNEKLKREIPKGWNHCTLEHYLNIKNGRDHKHLVSGLYPVYGSGGEMRRVSEGLYTGESVLMPRKGTLNNIMYVNETFWTVDTMFYSEMKVPHCAKFIFFTIKDIDFTRWDSGTGVPSMTASTLYAIPMLKPDNELLKRFDETITQIFQQTKRLKAECEKLTKQRDELLPLLMNGQVSLNSDLSHD